MALLRRILIHLHPLFEGHIVPTTDQYEWLFRKRLCVKPGLTCFWQISGRDDVSFEQWMKMDQDYIENWSVWLDVKILFRTVPVVLFGKGSV